MKIFIDSADVAEIREAQKLGCADGVTTNPTLIAKAGVPLELTIRAIAEIVTGPVNAEVTASTVAGIIAEGKKLHAWGDNVHVKIPLAHEGLLACKALADEGIPCTMTLVFSPSQAILAARELGKGRFEIVRLHGQIFGRAIYEPGWKWSESLKPIPLSTWMAGTQPLRSVRSPKC